MIGSVDKKRDSEEDGSRFKILVKYYYNNRDS